jgi:hypothetical protein
MAPSNGGPILQPLRRDVEQEFLEASPMLGGARTEGGYEGLDLVTT